MGSFYKQQLNDFVSNQEVIGDIVFDIGGAQHPIKGRTLSWNVGDYKIIDLAEPHVTLQEPDIAQDMNCHLDNKAFAGYLGMVDIIYCLGVFDYVINPNIAMDNIAKLLSKNGHAWVEFPYFYCTHNPIEEEGCRYSEGCIDRLAKQAKLEIVERIYKYPKPGNDHLVQFFIQDGMRMAKGVDHRITGFIFKFKKS